METSETADQPAAPLLEHSTPPSPEESFDPGLPVDITTIDRELKKLWATTSGVACRASLFNLAVYSEAAGSLGKNTAIISQITENHACRAIVIAADPAAPESGVEAWISAHCHTGRAEDKQICSEQLSFALRGQAAAQLPNIVFAQVDSDLPLYLWWQEEFRPPMDAQLWAWVDRVIYDSHAWRDFGAQMQLVRTAQEEARQRIVLCDLNWMRLLHFRVALAQFFDHPATHHHLAAIRRVEIEHAPGFRSTGLFLVGWLAGQLGWKGRSGGGDSLGFDAGNGDRADSGRPAIEISLGEQTGEPISRCTLVTEHARFCVEQRPGADLLEVSFGRTGGRQMRQLLPAGRSDEVSLFEEELRRGGPHRVYLRAVAQVRAYL